MSFLPTGRALGFGVVSHNQAWGADFFAHNYSCPANLPPTTGYVHNRALDLEAITGDLGMPQELRRELLRDLVEYAVDLLVAQEDRAIGAKVTSAALLRSAEFPVMLNGAYAWEFARKFNLPNFQAVKIITEAEAQFRKTAISYGQVLSQDTATATELLSVHLAELAHSLFGVDVPPQLVKGVLSLAMTLCADYRDEIQTVIDGVKANMAAHGIGY